MPCEEGDGQWILKVKKMKKDDKYDRIFQLHWKDDSYGDG